MHEWNNFFCRLLVGAPEADSGQPGVVKGGAVFKCPPESPGSCDLIQFDTKVSIIYFDLISVCSGHLFGDLHPGK